MVLQEFLGGDVPLNPYTILDSPNLPPPIPTYPRVRVFTETTEVTSTVLVKQNRLAFFIIIIIIIIVIKIIIISLG